ncbi:DUF4625 domain-containing protein [Tamlana haliotis]|uniref:DUF4625 domain-containing protein n=1 Tax=Pseudotamlana haliotis TaxID=2614804 RepID=A0A6N6MFR8_9FLAO|nr:DUF4625 domain-containing protein [Tamlana haliotis]KAB1068204.1 DUF4625 domain-containing protein [Tamlana haliotis]
MKTNIKLLALFLSLGIFFQSCSSDDDGGGTIDAPVITDFEYGEGDAHSTEPVAYKGSDLHIEAEIYAEGVISSITLEIHSHDLVPADDEVDWDFEQVYDGSKYQVINAEFHEHIDIPSNVPSGEYHVELIVTDELGNTTVAEGHLEILDPII